MLVGGSVVLIVILVVSFLDRFFVMMVLDMIDISGFLVSVRFKTVAKLISVLDKLIDIWVLSARIVVPTLLKVDVLMALVEELTASLVVMSTKLVMLVNVLVEVLCKVRSAMPVVEL